MAEATIDGLAGLIFQGRSSARLSLAASRFASSIMLATASGSANARDVMAVMRLRVPPGTPLRIRADGPDEAAALSAIVNLLAQGNRRP